MMHLLASFSGFGIFHMIRISIDVVQCEAKSNKHTYNNHSKHVSEFNRHHWSVSSCAESMPV